MIVNRNMLNCKDVLSPKEVAELLGLGYVTIYSLINTGQLHSISIGRKKLIPKQYVLEFLYPGATIEG